MTILHEAGFDKNMKIIVSQTPQTSPWLANGHITIYSIK